MHADQQQPWHSDGMARSITIRDVPDDVVDELASRAALTGRSLQEYLRARLISAAATEDAEAWVARVQARKAATGSNKVTTADVLEAIAADRR